MTGDEVEVEDEITLCETPTLNTTIETPTPIPTPASSTFSLSSEATGNKHVVIVMDGMQEFTTEPLEWALDNVIHPGSIVTLIGAMPWLNIPLSCKTWLDIWPLNLEETSFLNEGRECMNEAKYAKLEAVLELCRKYGVVPQKKVVMGHPLRLLIVEQISSLNATWVVFDKHQRSNKSFYGKKIKCNMGMLKDDGSVDFIKREALYFDSNNSQSASASVNNSNGNNGNECYYSLRT